MTHILLFKKRGGGEGGEGEKALDFEHGHCAEQGSGDAILQDTPLPSLD